MIKLKPLLKESIDDNHYMKLIKDNDIDSVQKMVDVTAKRNGYDIGPVYHTTHVEDDFYVFKPQIKRRFDGTPATKYGLIYFSADYAYYQPKWNKRNISGYLKIKNVWDYRNDDNVKDLANYLVNYFSSELGKKGYNFDLVRRMVASGHWGTIENYGIDYIKESGYDGIIMLESAVTPVTYAVFDSNQIKLSDPVTYDDKGMVIPLSQRFNSSNDDIRY